jgi:hypothetical protein
LIFPCFEKVIYQRVCRMKTNHLSRKINFWSIIDSIVRNQSCWWKLNIFFYGKQHSQLIRITNFHFLNKIYFLSIYFLFAILYDTIARILKQRKNTSIPKTFFLHRLHLNSSPDLIQIHSNCSFICKTVKQRKKIFNTN